MAANPSPAEILMGAEAERHELMAQETRNHLSNVRSEASRHEQTIAHIESVFQLRILPVPEVPYWITNARKADIETAMRQLRVADDVTLAGWLADIEVPGHVTPDLPGLRRLLAEASSDPDKVYPAWIMAQALLQVSKRAARS